MSYSSETIEEAGDLDTREIDHAVLMASVIDFYKDDLAKQQQRLNELKQSLDQLENNMKENQTNINTLLRRHHKFSTKMTVSEWIGAITIAISVTYVFYRIVESKPWRSDEASAVTNNHDNATHQL